MHRTAFAGLTALDAGDSVEVDGASFLTVNPDVTDRYLHVGCVTHRHDEHPAIPAPTGTLSASVSASGGQIPGGTAVYMGYTFVDAQGGETELSPVVVTNTQGPIVPELPPPTATVDYTTGDVPVGGFSYAFSYRDAAGGQTELQPAAFVSRLSGSASASVVLDGLSAGLASGLVSWEAWRADEGGAYNLLASGTTDEFIDTGFTCTDCSATPPTTNTTNHNGALRLRLPDEGSDPGVANASTIDVYLSTDGSFSNPSLYGVYGVASAGAEVVVTSLVLGTGSPPPVNRSLVGANKINPDTDILGPFKKAVANRSDLPLEGNEDGDVRETLDTHSLWVWDAAESEWQGAGGGGGGSGHIIQNPASVDMPHEAKLQFAGGVTVADDPSNDRTIVTITSGTSLIYEGPWSAEATYEQGDIVARSGGSYLALSETKGNDPATDEGVHWGILATPGAGVGASGVAIAWTGPWSNVLTYAEDDAVSFAGGSYVSLASGNLGHTPSTSPGQWGVIAEGGRPLNPRGPWLVGSTYAIQDVVERNGNAYSSKIGGNIGNDPALDVGETQWVLLVRRGEIGAGEPGPPGITWRGAYSSATTYTLRDTVLRSGSTYISVTEGNKGNDPETDGEVHWQLLASRGAQGKTGPKSAAGLRWRGTWSGTTTYEAKDVVILEGIYYVATAKGVNHMPPNALWWEVFSGGGPQESKVWAVSDLAIGVLPGFTVQVDEFSEANQQIIGFSLHAEGGPVRITVRKNGEPITELTGIAAEPGSPTYIDMTALKEAGEAGKFFPLQTSPGDYIDLEIESFTEGETLNISGTLHMRHITWGD